MGNAEYMGLHSRSTRSRVRRMISRVAFLVPLIAAAAAAPEARFSCEECVREMHGLAAMVKMGAIPIHDYIRDNYCLSLDSTAAQHFCEDPIMIAEFRIYLEQNFCLSDWDDCKALVGEHFTGMHVMAMEKFFIPTEICMQ